MAYIASTTLSDTFSAFSIHSAMSPSNSSSVSSLPEQMTAAYLQELESRLLPHFIELEEIKSQYEELDIKKEKTSDDDEIEAIEEQQNEIQTNLEAKEKALIVIWEDSLTNYIKNSYKMADFSFKHGFKELRIVSHLSFDEESIKERAAYVKRQSNKGQELLQESAKLILKAQDFIYRDQTKFFAHYCGPDFQNQKCDSWSLEIFGADKHRGRFSPMKVTFQLPGPPLSVVLKDRPGEMDRLLSDYLNQIDQIPNRKVDGRLYGVNILELPSYFVSEFIEGRTPTLSAGKDLKTQIEEFLGGSVRDWAKVKETLGQLAASSPNLEQQQRAKYLVEATQSLEATHTYTAKIGGGDYHGDNVKIFDQECKKSEKKNETFVIIIDGEVATGIPLTLIHNLSQTLLYQHCEGIMPTPPSDNMFSGREQEIIEKTRARIKEIEVRFLPIATTAFLNYIKMGEKAGSLNIRLELLNQFKATGLELLINPDKLLSLIQDDVSFEAVPYLTLKKGVISYWTPTGSVPIAQK